MGRHRLYPDELLEQARRRRDARPEPPDTPTDGALAEEERDVPCCKRCGCVLSPVRETMHGGMLVTEMKCGCPPPSSPPPKEGYYNPRVGWVPRRSR